MKKVLLTLGIFTLASVAVNAQTKSKKKAVKKAMVSDVKNAVVPGSTPTVTPVVTPPADAPVKTLPEAVPPPNEIDNFLTFDKLEHNFGKIPEGPQAKTTFTVTNNGNEPITISNVQASCGCTVPNWTKEPIAPGAKGTIEAIYNTQGRVSPFTKSLTVTTNKGTKMLTIKGEVEAAPAGSAPAQEGSMMKH